MPNFYIVRRYTQEDLYHADVLKLFQTVQATAEQLRGLVEELRPDVAKKLSVADIDFFPMIVQNWMIDCYITVLGPDAAAALWHHTILDNEPGVLLKFASRLLLSSSDRIIDCYTEDINEVLQDIPNKIQSPEDVDSLLEMDWIAPAEAVEAVEAIPLQTVQTVLEEIEEMGQMGTRQVPTLKLPARARLPKRWQPWKFLTVAMVVPWLLMHATAVHQPHARGASRPPVLQQRCLKGHVKFVGIWV